MLFLACVSALETIDSDYGHLTFAHNLKLIVSILTATTLGDIICSRGGEGKILKGFDKLVKVLEKS